MNDKLKGILVSIGTFIGLVVLTFIVGIIISATSSDGWAGLGAIIIMLFVTALAFIVLLIVGIVMYYKNKSQFGLGIIYGILGMSLFGIVSSLLISLYNSIV